MTLTLSARFVSTVSCNFSVQTVVLICVQCHPLVSCAPRFERRRCRFTQAGHHYRFWVFCCSPPRQRLKVKVEVVFACTHASCTSAAFSQFVCKTVVSSV